MVEVKELNCFAACVRTGSFSKAAEELFTTQSSVSKIIKAMEEELGFSLFERLSRGIRMTPEAEQMYPHVLQILEHMEKIQRSGKCRRAELLSVSCNPSSWFADHFVKYYEKKQSESIHYQIHSADCREIVERLRERLDDIGFLYILKNQLPAFQYYIGRNYLEFQVLKETEAVVYHGENEKMEGEEREGVDFSQLKLIQRFSDEFSPDNYWNITDENGKSAAAAETVITTNSDYIMERILQMGKLANISGPYLSGAPQREVSKGYGISSAGVQILFGYVKRKGEELSPLAEEFLNYLKETLS